MRSIKWYFKVLAAIVSTLLTLTLLFGSAAYSATIIVEETFQFRDVRSPNSIGIAVGERLTFGADVNPTGDNSGDGFADDDGVSPPTTITATQDGIVRDVLFLGPTVDPNRFVTSVPFDDGSGPFGADLRDAWSLSITNGPDNVLETTPDVQGIAAQPFVANMSLTGMGPTPTFNWTVPGGASPDRVSISIYDLEDFIGSGGIGGGGVANQFFFQSLSPTATNFSVPSGVLDTDHLYSVAIGLDDRRPGVPDTAGLASRSRSFFDFTTAILDVPAGTPVFLPEVDPTGAPGGTPIYSFDVDVTSGNTIFVDPLVALGYDYEIGIGDPFFGATTLPNVGDGMYSLWLFDNSGIAFDTGIQLFAGTAFDFTTELIAFGIGAEGLEKFRILGIEISAGLDPFNGTAFVTGLSFVGDGTFTGTMTPIVFDTDAIAAPEPTTIVLLGLGLAGLGFARRRRNV